MNVSPPRTIQLGQALHGYDGGHALLATSESLSHSVESALFVLSDLSGGQTVPGFEEYITGYPLQELSAYVFARTWYAPEMPRPGCVWTHTLFIRAADLALVEDCSVLRRYFRRPTRAGGNWSSYEKKLIAQVSGSEKDYDYRATFSSMSSDSDILSGLYGRPDAPVFVPSETSREYEDLVLKMWSQQWPRLRRTFRFCTGSIESRFFEGRPFDLQIIPLSGASVAQKELPNAVFLGKPLNVPLSIPDDMTWLRLASEDLWSPNLELREFLRQYGADVAAKRASYSRLLRAFDSLVRARSSELSFSALVERLLAIFPSGSDAAKLKLAVLRPFPSEGPKLQLPVSNQQRLLELATLTNDSALPKKIGDISEWAQAVLSEEEAETFQFIQSVADSPHVNAVGQLLLDSIAANIRPSQLQSANASPSVSLLLATRNPKLASDPVTWVLLTSRSHELLDLLASCNLAQDDWNRITRAAVEAHIPNVAAAFVRIVGASAVRTALEWAKERNSVAEIGRDWHQEFGNQSATVAEWLRHIPSPSPQILGDLTADLSPSDPAVLSLGSDLWLPAVQISKSLNTRSNVFLLVLGCQNPVGAPFKLVSEVFEKVHQAAGFDALGYESWQLLRDILPVLGPSKDWDVCERLRRLLVSRFLTFGWPKSALLRALENPNTLERTLQFVIGQRELRPFARDLVNDVEAGRACLTPEQSPVFHSYRKKLRR